MYGADEENLTFYHVVRIKLELSTKSISFDENAWIWLSTNLKLKQVSNKFWKISNKFLKSFHDGIKENDTKYSFTNVLIKIKDSK